MVPSSHSEYTLTIYEEPTVGGVRILETENEKADDRVVVMPVTMSWA